MTSGEVNAGVLADIGVGLIAGELEKLTGVREGGEKIDSRLLVSCAARLDELTANRKDFLSKRYEPLRVTLREGFKAANVRVRSDAHLYDLTRRFVKVVRASPRMPAEQRRQACTVCTRLAELATSAEQAH